MDYKDTLNLPKTDFSMKANLAVQEPIRLKKWDDADIYHKLLDLRKSSKPYILHDGPPYANGNIHTGTAINKILKDFVIKIKCAEGFLTPYIPGWDCHGLPIELFVDKQLGAKKENMTIAQIRKVCRAYADKYIDIQRTDFKRLGVFGDWANPYITMDFKYEAATLKELYKFFKNGGVYKGSKPVYWCHSCATALAEAEVEYSEHTSTSVYVKFAIKDEFKAKLSIKNGDKLSFVIWTTTPWTLPANLAIAVNPEYNYSIVKIVESSNPNLNAGEFIVIASDMLENVAKTFNIEQYEVKNEIKGKALEYIRATHPFYNRGSLIVSADYVTLEAGTGLVHTAPGHGQDDYETGLRYNLEILSPVDDKGKYKANVELFAGVHINDANKQIVELMQNNGSLLSTHKISHSYPHCWRCKAPLIFRATPQWFISMQANDLRAKAIDAINNKVVWSPSWGRNRILSMIENRPDWCISRQRIWGVPIAVFTCSDCGHIIFNDEIEKKVLAAFEKEGADAWFTHDNEYFLGEHAKCPKCNSENIKKETDILDVWFDSGTSHAAVCEMREGLSTPADIYLEGSDQHRGWFQSSLLESIGTRGVAPFKEVLTHGFVVDGQGRKMSKSIGNVVAPSEIINKYGVEILRLWIAAEDYTEDIRLSDDIITRMTESYRKIRNTARYILGNLSDFNPDIDMVKTEELYELDRNVLARWQVVKKRIFEAYDAHQFHMFYHAFLNFCINDLSSFYLDVIKDRAYSSAAHSKARRSAQTAMFKLIKEICLVISPILSFTADEIWGYLPNWNGKKEFVFFEVFPEIENIIAEPKWEVIAEVRKEVNKAIEVARQNKIVGHPLDAEITIATTNKVKAMLNVDEGIEKMFIVSKVTFAPKSELVNPYISQDGNIFISVKASTLEKCERCWIHTNDIGCDSNHPTICKRCVEAL